MSQKKLRWIHSGYKLILQTLEPDGWENVPMVDENENPTDMSPAKASKKKSKPVISDGKPLGLSGRALLRQMAEESRRRRG